MNVKRPEVERTVAGPMRSGIADWASRRKATRVLENRGSELAAEGEYLEATREPEFEVEPTPLVGGPSSLYPRAGTSLRPGTQFQGVSFDPQ